MSNQIVSLDTAHISYAVKKNGPLASITAEGALFKGGAALAALKDVAIAMALQKAATGRFQAATDILSAAFPKVAKAYSTLYGDKAPHVNKTQFNAFVQAVLVHEPTAKGWSKKQAEARLLVNALDQLLNPALQGETRGETVDA